MSIYVLTIALVNLALGYGLATGLRHVLGSDLPTHWRKQDASAAPETPASDGEAALADSNASPAAETQPAATSPVPGASERAHQSRRGRNR